MPGFNPSIITNKFGIIPAFKSGFIAVSVAIIHAFPTAFFKSIIFLFKDGPADTTIVGISSGRIPCNSSTLYPSYK